ncbi:3',5'-bisphosphate nucleotidase [Gigaspora rosea]|uniref:3'(2'),5'-bisphosphate nucleotidase n=1 Tax=Gigaspora rosea TaxID=44941 RepID=A0A397V731_9GLOM|nr:3',5'-bisphosphate nucleotidase [Gigaspora rosea]
MDIIFIICSLLFIFALIFHNTSYSEENNATGYDDSILVIEVFDDDEEESKYELKETVAINAVLRASKICQKVFQKLVMSDTVIKKDRSPVTVADFSAQAVVNKILYETFPNDLIVGEEESGCLQGDNRKELKNKVLSLANSVLDTPLNDNELLDTINRGSSPGGSSGRIWALDPIDGTKGFLRGEQFCIGLALIIDRDVHLGVLGCPNLLVDLKTPEGEKGCLFVAIKGKGAFQHKFSSTEETQIHLADISSPSAALFCESVVAEHSSHGDAAKIASFLGITKPPLHMDSMCKYCVVARGDADIYLSLPVRVDYEENIWDHAAGCILIKEAGGIVSDINNKPLDFSLGRTLKTNKGVVVAHSKIHGQVIDVVQQLILKK